MNVKCNVITHCHILILIHRAHFCLVAPDNVALHLPSVAVKGKSATFRCTANGNPTPTYTWLKDGKPVGSSQMFSIESVSYAIAGKYVCLANNTIEAGWKTGRASDTVKVEGIVITNW